MAKRKYQDVEKLLEQNPGMTIPEAGRQLGYERELQNKGQGRVGLRNRQVDQARAKAEAMQRGEAPRYKPPQVPGFEQHHKRMVMLYRPLFEGLSDADALELSKYAAAQGLDLGDVESNFELLSKDHHNKIHRYMEQQGMRPSYMPDFSKADLANRKKAFNVLYKDFIQADIDKTTSLLVKNGSIRFAKPVSFGMSIISEYGDVVDELTGGAISNAINTAVVNPLRQAVGQEPVGPYQKPDPLANVQAVKRAKEAVQRGGQVSFGLGGARFTLPELGLSEVLGLN